ncbi:MAG: response regulator [Sphingomicrobium sp.]
MASVSINYCYIVDDDPAFRASLVALLATAGFELREFDNADDFLAASPRLMPAPLLLDLRMAGTDGLELLERAGRDLERFAVIMISGHGDIDRAVRSIKAGAIDFLEKPFRPGDLLALLEAAQISLNTRLDRLADRRDAEARIGLLSPREREVLRLLLNGAPNKIVARTLDLSVRTVEMHRAHMLAKLSAKSTAEAIHLAMLAEVPPWG